MTKKPFLVIVGHIPMGMGVTMKMHMDLIIGDELAVAHGQDLTGGGLQKINIMGDDDIGDIHFRQCPGDHGPGFHVQAGQGLI